MRIGPGPGFATGNGIDFLRSRRRWHPNRNTRQYPNKNTRLRLREYPNEDTRLRLREYEYPNRNTRQYPNRNTRLRLREYPNENTRFLSKSGPDRNTRRYPRPPPLTPIPLRKGYTKCQGTGGCKVLRLESLSTRLCTESPSQQACKAFPCKELYYAKATINGIFNHGKQEGKPVQSLVERIVRQHDGTVPMDKTTSA